jgi:TPR repeat protein
MNALFSRLMKFQFLFRGGFVLFLLLSLCACAKKAETERTPAVAVTTRMGNAAPALATNVSSSAAKSNALIAAVSNSVKVAAPPKPVYPAQEIYEQGIALIKTNESTATAEQAIKFFQEAADKGNPPAQRALGLSYLGGIGIKKNVDEGLKWLRKSADAGYADAQFKLASLYARGDILPKDENLAAEFARKAAEQGHAEAEYNLGTLYTAGKGVPKDLKEAAAWFKKAAEAGQASAQSNIGVLYANGEVFDKNMDEAIKWWKKAAEQGQPSAQFNLAQALTEGKALPKDLVEAYKWYYLSAQQGDTQAAQLRDAVAAELDPAQLADALRRARQFKSDLVAKWQAKEDVAF